MGREILAKQHPQLYSTQDLPQFEEPFLFSTGWMRGFYHHFGFSSQRFTTTKTILRDKGKVIKTVQGFHLETRVFQLSFDGPPPDPVYGIASPEAVFNRNQVPIALCPSYARTVDKTGNPVILNSLDFDNKHFCTLNLFVPMKVCPDLKNVPKPHLVFRAATKGGEDWADADEREQWHPDVVVSFQDNAWVDAQTNIYSLQKVLKPVDNFLGEEGKKGVLFEDNLSSHLTDAVVEHWSQELENFFQPRYYPANLSLVLQAINRHLGICYKVAVTKAVCAFLV
jgi:hypothetical protein